MARALFTATVAFGLLFSCGCIFPYCTYPTLDYTPAVNVETKDSDVRAFRVDISKPTADLSVFKGPVYEELTEIPVKHDERIEAQIKPSAAYGFVIIGIALNYLTHHSESLALRIYRPGFETVEIRTWELVNKVVWKPAPSLEAQEAALDKLLPSWRADSPRTKTAANRKALEFIAGEYERIAVATRDMDQRKRMEEKAGELRRLSEGENDIAK